MEPWGGSNDRDQAVVASVGIRAPTHKRTELGRTGEAPRGNRLEQGSEEENGGEKRWVEVEQRQGGKGCLGAFGWDKKMRG